MGAQRGKRQRGRVLAVRESAILFALRFFQRQSMMDTTDKRCIHRVIDIGEGL